MGMEMYAGFQKEEAEMSTTKTRGIRRNTTRVLSLRIMGAKIERHPLDYYAKEWSRRFSKDQNFKEDGSWVDSKRKMDAVGDEFGIFLEDAESSVPCPQVEEVQEFCQGIRLEDLVASAVREYGNPLTATSLYQALKVKRYNTNIPDADRRLIYIANLDPYYILALAQTAPHHQISVLRDAIWKHLAFQTSIRVKNPHVLHFQMEFHIPYLVLRVYRPPFEEERREGTDKSRRKWIDLTFLKIQPPKTQVQQQYGVLESQVSFVVCGSDNRRWTGYAFADTDFEDEDLVEDNFPYMGFHEDPIALNGLDANIPIRDARDYFLTVAKVRMKQVLREWEYLVRAVELSIARYSNQHNLIISQPSRKTGDRIQEAKMALGWTQQTMELLSLLLNVLSKPIKAWEVFNSSNGDISYFSDVDSLSGSSRFQRQLSLRVINEIFETLQALQQTLYLLEKSCSDSAEVLKLRLTIEGNESLQQNGFSQEFTTSITNPVLIAIALFSMPQTAAPFKLDSKYFILAIFIIIVLMKLLLAVVAFLPRVPFWWAKIRVWSKERQLCAAACSMHLMRRGTPNVNQSMDGAEMEVLDV